VVDAVTVLVTHLGELLRRHANELLSREDLQKMLNRLRESSPTIVDELKPEVVRSAVLRRVLTNLLSERIPIASLELILESIVHHGLTCKDPDVLTDKVREDIGQIICSRFRNENGFVRVIVVDPNLESRLRSAVVEGRMAIPAQVLERLVDHLRKSWEPSQLSGKEVALLVDGSIRRHIRRAIERALPDLPCISYAEIPNDLMIDPVSILRFEEIFTDGSSPAGISKSGSNDSVTKIPAASAAA
jgi:flagellar biosynthesis protein FlhA